MAGGEEDVKVRDKRMHVVVARGHQFEGGLHGSHQSCCQYLACKASAQQPGRSIKSTDQTVCSLDTAAQSSPLLVIKQRSELTLVPQDACKG